jgi:hypothetical protein
MSVREIWSDMLPHWDHAALVEPELCRLGDQAPVKAKPSKLPWAAIRQERNVFQPRFQSIAYAPGKVEDHVHGLAQALRRGQPLDPVTVAAFGDQWLLIDGHHRMMAYKVAGWTKDIPVKVLQSELRGAARLAWAKQESVRDNQKARLQMGQDDKADAAWRDARSFAADGNGLSKAAAAANFGVSPSTIANQRRTAKELQEFGVDLSQLPTWRRAQRELVEQKGTGRGGGDFDFDAARRMKIGARLAPLLKLKPSPVELARVLEEYEPGLVETMAGWVQEQNEGRAAWEAEGPHDECDI